ncbi:aminoglycoside phosphotransferase [Actinotalea ferrariae]|uniref:maltokinase N-terminal cap-like domain-containing protein n=1 Tax=Actinotalea ferrariae TaxID=1386098 RepID=UPI001C8BBA5A|nr:aminoglycoside phosphotransferase [Actinotalea ferrariae]MBX9246357.1 aminoglycoside phosphotransferase [Actinotalea ferrariae]
MDGSTTDNPPVHARVPEDGDAGAELGALVEAWLPGRRWYPAKGSTRTLPLVAVVRLEDPAGEAEVRIELRRLAGGGLLQVPLVLRAPGGEDAEGAAATRGPSAEDESRPEVVGHLADGTTVIDGAYDAAFLRAWLAAADGDAAGAVGDDRGAAPLDLTGAKVMTGEQSNTSVLLPSASPPAILKVFRTVGEGPNPDVEVPLALSRAGWQGVPRPLAWLTASWPADGVPASGHLGVMSELVLGAQDGFELACRYAREAQDFTELAADLGRTTAQMHLALRTALPASANAGDDGPADAADDAQDVARTVLATLRERAAAAVDAAPVLSDRHAAVDRVLERVAGLDLPPLQRVHGDYHLGQVLRSADRGWVVLDFEGEPQASAAERTRPDLALRDVAGMLRSIDYAAAVGQGSAAWAEAARDALVQGYFDEVAAADGGEGAAGHDGTGAHDGAATHGPAGSTATLLHALELDKALYEVVYESRNRPDWVAIPLGGVDRLLDAA